jgi:hypothetical protein
MSRAQYDALMGGSEEAWAEEGASPSPFLQALGREGRLRRAARQLADDELREGTWVVDDNPSEATAPLRLAAKDRDAVVRYTGGTWVLVVETNEAGARTVRQDAGPFGGTLVLGGATPVYVPLVSEKAVPLVLEGALPDVVEVVDAAGRSVRLRRG